MLHEILGGFSIVPIFEAYRRHLRIVLRIVLGRYNLKANLRQGGFVGIFFELRITRSPSIKFGCCPLFSLY